MRMRNGCLAALIVTSLVLPARAANEAVSRQIQTQMKRFQVAFVKKDLAGVRAITTPDFTVKTKSGHVSTRREAEAAMATEMNSLRAVDDWSLNIDKIFVKGNTATLFVTERMAAKIADATGAIHSNVSMGRMREIWVKSGKTWYYKRCEALSMSSGPDNMKFESATRIDNNRPDKAVALKAIQAQYENYKMAVRNRNLWAAVSTMTSDATVIYPNGRTLTTNETRRSLKATLDSLRSIKSWELKIANLNVGKGTALATIGERMVTTFADYNGKVHTQELIDFYNDTWIRTDRGWRLRNTRILRGTVKIDGKKIDPFK